MPIAEVTREAIQKYVADLITDGYAPKTIDHIHDVSSALPVTARASTIPGSAYRTIVTKPRRLTRGHGRCARR